MWTLSSGWITYVKFTALDVFTASRILSDDFLNAKSWFLKYTLTICHLYSIGVISFSSSCSQSFFSPDKRDRLPILNFHYWTMWGACKQNWRRIVMKRLICWKKLIQLGGKKSWICHDYLSKFICQKVLFPCSQKENNEEANCCCSSKTFSIPFFAPFFHSLNG